MKIAMNINMNLQEQIYRIQSMMMENNSSQEKIRGLIKSAGLKNASEIVGGIERLVKLGYDNDIKEYAKDNDIKLVEISDNNPPNMFIDDLIIEKLNLSDFSKSEKELGKFRYGPYGKGEDYLFNARVRKVKKIVNGIEQNLWHVVGTSGSYGFGYSYLSKVDTMGKKVRLQIFKQIIDKYNLSEFI